MMHRIILVFLATSINAPCQAFKEVKIGPNRGISTLAKDNSCVLAHCHPRRRRDRGLRQSKSISLWPLLSIRGGSDDYDEDGYDEDGYDGTAYEFIASFESELAEIRHEAEREAEDEMQKLRSLIELRGAVEELKSESEPNKNGSDESNENGELEAAVLGNKGGPTEGDWIEEEKPQALPNDETVEDIDQEDIESDEASEYIEKSGIEGGEKLIDDGVGTVEKSDIGSESLATDDVTEAAEKSGIGSDTADVASESIDKSDGESDVRDEGDDQTISAEDDRDLQHDETDLHAKTIEAGDHLADSESEEIYSQEPSISAADYSTVENGEGAEGDVIEDIMPKASKKKRKLSKTSKSKAKKKNRQSEESELSGLGRSATLAFTEDELVQPPQSGILFYLRSDLGRALCLFLSTVLLALLTQRLQRQLEAEGN